MGVDISQKTLTILQKRLARAKEPFPISYQKVGVTKLPFQTLLLTRQ